MTTNQETDKPKSKQNPCHRTDKLFCKHNPPLLKRKVAPLSVCQSEKVMFGMVFVCLSV